MTYSRLANPRETRAVLEDFGLATKHRLGQNFLVNDEVIGRIVNLAELDGCKRKPAKGTVPFAGFLMLV